MDIMSSAGGRSRRHDWDEPGNFQQVAHDREEPVAQPADFAHHHDTDEDIVRHLDVEERIDHGVMLPPREWA